jgi:4-hydroxy-2-oxoheptanedioate aldolase
MAGQNPVSRFGRTLRGQDLHLSAFVQTPDVHLVEAMARTSADSLVLDAQHGMFTEAAVAACVGAAALFETPCLVRIPVDAFATASRVLDFGAAGVICPMVNTPEAARRLVAHVKYPPVGERSWGPRRAAALGAVAGRDYLDFANECTLAFAMIETAEALANIAEIAATPGLDGVFVGPVDLTVSLSAGQRIDTEAAETLAAIDRVSTAAAEAGILAGIFTLSVDQAIDFRARGFRFVALGQDSFFLTTGLERAYGEARRRFSEAGGARG